MTVPTIILCGGRGTRISEYSATIPKPLIPVGDRPILWHIMTIYASQGHTEFVLALGWRGTEIRRYFLEFQAMTSDFTVELGTRDSIQYHQRLAEHGWRVTCVDTGQDTLTGSRIVRAAQHLQVERLMVTYGDGLADIDLNALLKYHEESGRLATITAVRPTSRFGEMTISDSGRVTNFIEKPSTGSGAVNGGFMVFESAAIAKYFPVDQNFMLEAEPLVKLARDGQLTAYAHGGFWQQMDTPRERELLDELWRTGSPPWRTG
jgi:glucose-1-phosphate cytidylyltransferase